MIKDKNFDCLKRNESNEYVINGSLVSYEDIVVALDNNLVVTWSIKSYGDIKSNGYIHASHTIVSRGCITSENDIIAGASLQCKALSTKSDIFAGVCIKYRLTEKEQQIICEELVSGTVKHGELVILKPTN